MTILSTETGADETDCWEWSRAECAGARSVRARAVCAE